MKITKAVIKKASSAVSYPYSITLPIAVKDEIDIAHTVTNDNVIIIMENKTQFCKVIDKLHKNKNTKLIVPLLLKSIEIT